MPNNKSSNIARVSNKQHQHMEIQEASSTTLEEYPTSSTVPFPYTQPYQVQLDLMDAMLSALRPSLLSPPTTTSISISSSHNNASSESNGKTAANNNGGGRVILLESPTGTGKSLSLACASLAWLHYMHQHVDLAVQHQMKEGKHGTTASTKDEEKKKEEAILHVPTFLNNVNHKKTSPSSAIDWIDAWSPHTTETQQDEIEEQDDNDNVITRQVTKCKEMAATSRQELLHELNLIRFKIIRNRQLSVIASKTSTSTNTRVKQEKLENKYTKVLASRQEVAQKAIENIIQNEKLGVNISSSSSSSNNSKSKKHKKITTKVTTKVQQQQHTKNDNIDDSNNNNNKVQGVNCDDYCLDDYQSDCNMTSNNNKYGGTSSSDEDSSCSSRSSTSIKPSHVKSYYKNTQKSSSIRKSSRERTQPQVVAANAASLLLNGKRLDGSSAAITTTTSSKSRNNHVNCNNNNKEATASVTAVANVRAGSGCRKIIYAARTHSQLSQFVNEIRRTSWGSLSSSTTTSSSTTSVTHEQLLNNKANTTMVVTLGGRKLLCGNKDVTTTCNGKKKRNEQLINEYCLDLQKSKSNKKEGGDTTTTIMNTTNNKRRMNNDKNNRDNSNTKTCCPLLKYPEAVSTLAMHMLAQPCDIEDMAALGQATHTCSYYASRQALPAAEVVVVPYATLLSKQARDAVGLSLTNSLVIIDEAHNIPEALRSISACRLTLPMAEAAFSQLQLYIERYTNRLAGRNLFYLGQLTRCINSIITFLRLKKLKQQQRVGAKTAGGAISSRGRGISSSCRSSVMLSLNEMLFELKLDNINLYKLDRYLNTSKLPQKLLGFTNYRLIRKEDDDDKEEKRSSDSVGMTMSRNAKGGNRDGEIENNNQENDNTANSVDFVSKHISAMSTVQQFLSCLNSNEKSGKIVLELPPPPSTEDDTTTSTADTTNPANSNCNTNNNTIRYPTLRFVLLDPSSKFNDIVNDAYGVVLAGGTLRPFAHVASELLSDGIDDGGGGRARSMLDAASKADSLVCTAALSPSQTMYTSPKELANFTVFSCSHVVPPSHVFLASLATGPTLAKLDFRHDVRTSDAVCDELGRVLVNFANIVPGGMILFLPSYVYEAHLHRRWKKTGVLDKVRMKKTIHREPKNAQDVECALEAYATDASSSSSSGKNGGGAILVCVIGGKMSEGINFADDMARCVIVAGLPYPDISDPELVEKMSTLDRGHKEGDHGITGRSYYQNLCMRAINQSVGRAIRHEKDYAAIILADYRYATDVKIWHGLASWLRGNQSAPRLEGFGQVVSNLRTFFRERTLCGKI